MKHSILTLAALAALAPAPALASHQVTGLMQTNHDPVRMTVQGAPSGACAPQTECQLGDIDYPLGTWFGNTNYSCYASQQPGATIPAVFEFYPQTVGIVAVQFFNFTGNAIASGTVLNLAVTCYGLAGGKTPHR